MGHVLAVDTGSKSFGWCVVRRIGPRVAFVDCGTADATRSAWVKVLSDAIRLDDGCVDAVYVETPEGMVFSSYRGPTLIETSRLVGGIAWDCEGMGVRCELRTSNWWRKALVGKASSPKKGLMDKLIADAVPANVIGWPAKSNVHVRDAGGLAVVAGWELAKGEVAA